MILQLEHWLWCRYCKCKWLYCKWWPICRILLTLAICASWPFLSTFSNAFYFNQNSYGGRLHTWAWDVELFCQGILFSHSKQKLSASTAKNTRGSWSGYSLFRAWKCQKEVSAECGEIKSVIKVQGEIVRSSQEWRLHGGCFHGKVLSTWQECSETLLPQQ